jgi:hypothetical protein
VSQSRSPWLALACSAALSAFAVGSSGAATLLPAAQGMMHLYPELGGALVIHEDHLVVGYQKTTDVNRQIQRAFLEFALGAEPAASAQLVLEFFPSSEGRFELYAGDAAADLAIRADDFDRSATLLASFDPVADGAPLPGGLLQLSFDVTERVNGLLGTGLGFQLRLQGDLARTDFAILGGELSGPRDPRGSPRLVIQPIPEPGTAALLAFGLLALGPPACRRVCR